MSQVIFRDFNVYDDTVSESTDTVLEDTKVVVQSVWRLLTTQEGEIPNYREYGLNIKNLVQLPYSVDTINSVYEYVAAKLEKFESRAKVIRADVDGNVNTGEVHMTFYIKVKATGETVAVPTWTVQVSSSY